MDWKAQASSGSNRPGDLPKNWLNFETALMYDRWSAGDMFRTVMSSIIRRLGEGGSTRPSASEGWASTSTSSHAGDPHKIGPLTPRLRFVRIHKITESIRRSRYYGSGYGDDDYDYVDNDDFGAYDTCVRSVRTLVATGRSMFASKQ